MLEHFASGGRFRDAEGGRYHPGPELVKYLKQNRRTIGLRDWTAQKNEQVDDFRLFAVARTSGRRIQYHARSEIAGEVEILKHFRCSGLDRELANKILRQFGNASFIHLARSINIKGLVTIYRAGDDNHTDRHRLMALEWTDSDGTVCRGCSRFRWVVYRACLTKSPIGRMVTAFAAKKSIAANSQDFVVIQRFNPIEEDDDADETGKPPTYTYLVWIVTYGSTGCATTCRHKCCDLARPSMLRGRLHSASNERLHQRHEDTLSPSWA
eukprot:m.181080 g.181080  ORF g.181080 m.181080 type:complete len:268 (+) comp16869_c0_seq4:3355-4158(+)